MAAICGAFWWQDLRYSLPTPVPAGLKAPAIGTPVSALASGRPTLLNFYNPSCPCSRFNLPHLQEIARHLGGRGRMVLVLPPKATVPDVPGADVLRDREGRLAAQLGVYASPQAVVLDAEGRIAYRGNYNTARYCRSPKTEFARIAFEAVLAGRSVPAMPISARVAYGCALPKTGSIR